jgi:hypothetical protein
LDLIDPCALPNTARIFLTGAIRRAHYLRQYVRSWETVPTVKKKMPIPKKGDRVAVTGRKGSYVVFLVDESLQVADLKQIGGDERLATIPWNTLAFVDEEAR